jgi:beta-phosphoglucomutase-like phosphatase (HAD superfamily)
MDGVRSFLDSRGIELPYGDDDDGPGPRRRCAGLGNRKDRYFNAWLEENQVRSYPGTLSLIDALRAAGIKDRGVLCQSQCRSGAAQRRRARPVRRRVDGSDRGGSAFPASRIRRCCWRRRGVWACARAHAVVEDAIAGVEAGVRGAFGLVIGVARGGMAMI